MIIDSHTHIGGENIGFSMGEDNLDIVIAIKLHPYYNRVSPLDKKVKPYIELCEKYHLAFVCHTAILSLSCRTFQLYLTAPKHPNVNFMAAHHHTLRILTA